VQPRPESGAAVDSDSTHARRHQGGAFRDSTAASGDRALAAGDGTAVALRGPGVGGGVGGGVAVGEGFEFGVGGFLDRDEAVIGVGHRP